MIGIPPSVSDRVTRIKRKSRDPVSVDRGAVRTNRFDLIAQFGGHAFVGIEIEDPIVESVVHAELLLVREAGPGICDDAGSECSSEIARSIRALGINDQNLVG